MKNYADRLKKVTEENKKRTERYLDEVKVDRDLSSEQKQEMEKLWRDYVEARNKFEQDYNIFSGQVTSFQEQLDYLIDAYNINHSDKMSKATIARAIGISEQTLSLYSSGHHAPSMNTLIAICIVLKLDIKQASALLTSLGFCFLGTRREHYAYMYLLENCRGKSIEDCNKILTGLYIEEKYQLYPRKKKEQKTK